MINLSNPPERPYPLYGETDEDLLPGLYLALFHGFANEGARRKNAESGGTWGANGPVIGPLNYIHTTYAQHIELEFVDDERAAVYGLDSGLPDLSISSQNGCVLFSGMEYGDWTAYVIVEA